MREERHCLKKGFKFKTARRVAFSRYGLTAPGTHIDMERGGTDSELLCRCLFQYGAVCFASNVCTKGVLV